MRIFVARVIHENVGLDVFDEGESLGYAGQSQESLDLLGLQKGPRNFNVTLARDKSRLKPRL